MLQVKRTKNRSPFIVTVITFVMALLALIMMSGSVFSSSSHKTLESQTIPQESQQTDVRELKLGVPTERELVDGARHSYSIAVTAGQYLHVAVKQKGIDVVIRLSGPDRKKLTEVDNEPTGGSESVFVVADVSGDYEVEVHSADEGAKAGRYEIGIEEMREATPKDRGRVRAQKAVEEANELRDQQTADARQKAIKKYEDALLLWGAADDKDGESRTLIEIGLIYSRNGEPQKAMGYFTQSLHLSQSTGNRRLEAQTLGNIGMSYWRRGQSDKALEYAVQSLHLARGSGDRYQEATALNNIGLAYVALGQLQEALKYYHQALPLWRDAGERLAEGITLNNIGNIYLRLGEFQNALQFYGQALRLKQAAGDRRGEANTLHNIGGVYENLGDFRKALEYYNQTIVLSRAVGDRPGEVVTLDAIGLAYNSLGEPQTALVYHNQALELSRAVRDRRLEGHILSHIGLDYQDLGDFQKALEYLNQALSIRHEVGDRYGEAYSLSGIGSGHTALGQPQKALGYYLEALRLSREIGDRKNEAVILYKIARVERDQGKTIEAKAHIEAAIDIIETTRARVASQGLRTSYFASNQDYYEFHIALLMKMHQAQPSAGHDVAAFGASERARARGLLEMLTEARIDIRQGVDPMLLERKRSLQHQLSAKAERLTRLLSGKHTEDQETAARREVDALVADNKDVAEQIRAKSPRYAALTQPQPLSVKEIQQILDKDTVLLEYALGEERSYLWIATPTLVSGFELPKRVDIEAAARQVHKAVTARNTLVRFEKQENKRARVAQADAEYFAASAILSQMLLGPVAGRLGRKRLLIVSDGALQYLPFGALPVPDGQLFAGENKKNRQSNNYRPLITEHEIVSLPSASTLAVIRKELISRQRGAKTVAVLADPVFQSDDPRVRRDSARSDNQGTERSSKSAETPELTSTTERSTRDKEEVEFRRLPFSRQEAEGIAALTSNAMRKESLDFEANRMTATSAELSDYRIIHFATHGLLDSQHPELSGIVLSLVDKGGKPQDGFLRLSEIYDLKLGADLVVLSACRTALGKEIKGEGLVGLTRGFMYAGAPRVVASLWAVDDEITAELMKRFYREILVKKQRPAAALRAAQVSIWKERRLPPYYWAAFILQGEWK